MFATKFDLSQAPVRTMAAPSRASTAESVAPEQNLLWQALAVRPGSLQKKSDAAGKLSKLAYGPAAPGQAYPGQAPPVQAYPGQVPVAQAPLQAPLGPIEQARSDAGAALAYAIERVRAAISARDGIGIVPHDVDDALRRFFPGFDDSFLEDILARIQPMGGWLPNMLVRRIPFAPGTAPPGYRDAVLLNSGAISPYAHTFVRRVLPMMDPGPDYAMVFPDWYKEPDLQATRLLHESFHYMFVGMYHAPPLNDAFAWQGFVSIVSGLPTGPIVDKHYPPLK
jgi:hypothetical protein